MLLQIIPADSTATAHVSNLASGLTDPLKADGFDLMAIASEWLTAATNFGIRVALAILLFFVGRYAIRWVRKIVHNMLERKRIEGVAISLFDSLFTALLYIALAVSIALLLGIQSASFAAVIGAMGLAVGMALSGQLQNLAGGVIIMLTKPFKIGDVIDAQGQVGIVRSVSLFHSHISTFDNKSIYIPNGILSSGVITNITEASTRRIEWIFGIDYESDHQLAISILREQIRRDERILDEPEAVIAIQHLSASSVDIVVRAWVNSDDYWAVYWQLNEQVLKAFPEQGIQFPFPQVTISQRKG